MRTSTKHLLQITNPIDPIYNRGVIITGKVTQAYISKAIEALDDRTPTGLIPDSKGDYFVAIMPYEG